MKTAIIEYAMISPAVLANAVERAYNCLTVVKDIDEDFYEFSVFGVSAYAMAELEDYLAEFV